MVCNINNLVVTIHLTFVTFFVDHENVPFQCVAFKLLWEPCHTGYSFIFIAGYPSKCCWPIFIFLYHVQHRTEDIRSPSHSPKGEK